MKRLIVASSIVLFGLIGAGTTHAYYGSTGCEPIYGGGQSCETSNKFTLDKKVMNPTSTKGGSTNFVDNLSINDPKYAPSQTIVFELTVTNTGNSTLKEVIVTDTLPSYVAFVSGPGSYDKNSKVVTFKVTDLKAGESKRYTIEAKVVDASKIPGNSGIVCAVNQASAKYNGDESRDNSQFCIEKTTKGGFPVQPAPKMTQTPSTGAESLALIGLIPAAAGGLFLRRRSK